MASTIASSVVFGAMVWEKAYSCGPTKYTSCLIGIQMIQSKISAGSPVPIIGEPKINVRHISNSFILY
jgi:hypothetical protein